jgi:hypothetical protein
MQNRFVHTPGEQFLLFHAVRIASKLNREDFCKVFTEVLQGQSSLSGTRVLHCMTLAAVSHTLALLSSFA